jgi:hypothetical protein
MKNLIKPIILVVLVGLCFGCGRASSSNSADAPALVDSSSVSKVELNGRTFEDSSLIETLYSGELIISGTLVEVSSTIEETTEGTTINIPISSTDLGLDGDQTINIIITVQD